MAEQQDAGGALHLAPGLKNTHDSRLWTEANWPLGCSTAQRAADRGSSRSSIQPGDLVRNASDRGSTRVVARNFDPPSSIQGERCPTKTTGTGRSSCSG